MGIFGAGSGGLFVVATGFVELAFAVLRTVDDSLDLLRGPGICIFQELRADCLFSRFWIGLLFVAAARKLTANYRNLGRDVYGRKTSLGRLIELNVFVSVTCAS